MTVTLRDYERLVECCRCHELIIVCGAVGDLPEPYRCLSCRPVAYNEFPKGY